MRNLPAAAAMTAHEARSHLTGHTSDEVVRETAAILETLEATEYGGASAIDLPGALSRTESLIPRLHRELEKGSVRA